MNKDGEDIMTEEMKGRPRITKAGLDELRSRLDSMDRRMDEMKGRCEECRHDDCDCPERIEALDRSTDARMDIIDQNVQTVQDNLELAYDRLRGQIDEETRLRAGSDERIASLNEDIGRLSERVRQADSDAMKLGIVAAVAGAVSLIVLALAVTGHI